MTNRCLVRSILDKTPYELLTKKKPKLIYFKPFGCECFVLNDGKEDLRKFNLRSDEEIFVGCTSTFKAYKIYKKGHDVWKKVFM